MRTIKRYTNRKLYDTTERHYVTLADVARFIRKGEMVQVTDYITHADLTNQTLAQIIFEEAKQVPRIDTKVFVELIQRHGDPKQEAVAPAPSAPPAA